MVEMYTLPFLSTNNAHGVIANILFFLWFLTSSSDEDLTGSTGIPVPSSDDTVGLVGWRTLFGVLRNPWLLSESGHTGDRPWLD